MRNVQAKEAQRCLQDIVTCVKFCSKEFERVVEEPDRDMFYTMDELSSALEDYDNVGTAAEVQGKNEAAKDAEDDKMSLPSDLNASWYDYPRRKFDHPVENLE